MVQPSVSAGLALGLVQFASAHGARAAELCERAGVAPAELEDPDHRVPLERYRMLMRAAQSATENPALALHFGEAIGMRELSIVGLLMEASATVGDAYVQMRRYGRLAIEAASDEPRFELVEEAQRLFLVDRQRAADAFRELTEGAFAWLICGPRRYMERSPVVSVQVTWPAPSYRACYEQVFRCPVEFGARWNALQMHPESLGWTVSQNPRYVFGLLTERADALLAELDADTTTAGRLERFMSEVLHRGDMSADAMAKKMGFSRQTLFRRLREEETSFSEVLDGLRHRLAKEYLRGGKLSVNEVAYLVGFSDAPAFSRAFKRWTSQSPGSFRRAASKQQ